MADLQAKEQPTRLVDVKYAVVMALAVTAVAVAVRWNRGDVDLCRDVFRGMVQGNVAVARRIDWAHLQALHVDIGAQYSQITDPKVQSVYRQVFINRFAEGFKYGGGQAVSFVNWRLKERTPQGVVVAADYPAKQKILLFTLSTSGPKRVTAIRWQ